MYQIHDTLLLEIMVSIMKKTQFVYPKKNYELDSLGVRMPLGTLIQKSRPDYHSYLRYNEYIVYDESQVALRYLVQFRR